MPEQPIAERITKKLIHFVLFIIVFLLLAVGVMYLWNSILLPVAHVKAITYLQSLALMILCRLLFGNLNLGRIKGDRWQRNRGPEDKLINTNEDSRAAFKEEWRKRCERWKQS